MSTMTATATATKLARNQFRCFHCRRVFSNRDGSWVNWSTMQVHLCKPCNQVTAKAPERA